MLMPKHKYYNFATHTMMHNYSRFRSFVFSFLVILTSLNFSNIGFAQADGSPRTLRDVRKEQSQPETLGDLRLPKNENVVYLNTLERLGQTLRQSRERKNISGQQNVISLKGIKYKNGLAVPVPSELRFSLDRQYSQFRASIGLSDEAGARGAVVFQVFADGVRIFDSAKMTGSTWTRELSLNVAGCNELKLVVTGAGDGGLFDRAVWADARVEKSQVITNRAGVPAHRHNAGIEDADHLFNDYILAEKAKSYPVFVAAANETIEADPSLVGTWSAKVTWPFVFASAASLPDGRILAWGGNNPTSFSGGTSTYAAVWNPTTNQITSINNNSHAMFCGIPVMLEDGRVFVNGGDANNNMTSVFDFRTNLWTRLENMNRGRWYPGTVALPNGKVFTALGEPGDVYPEIWTPGQGWSLLTGANLQAPILNFAGYQNNWLPYLQLAPNGSIFHAGPTQQMNWINPTGSGSVASAGISNTWYPKYAGAVMFDEGKILVTGGQLNGSTQTSSNQAQVINITGATATKTLTMPMANARKFHNAVVLPNGEVMVVGGNTSGIEFSDQGTVLTPEIWNPTTQAWRAVADLSIPRNYHSVALLMPDGRVWSGGGGLCACAADHPDHQIFTPPYLYKPDGSLATRPAISTAPSTTAAGRIIVVQGSAGITKFTLVKMTGLTHTQNSDLHFMQVPFTVDASGQYQLMLSSNVNVLTPGYWMLFALNANGVPSIAKVMQIFTNGAPTITNPGAKSTLLGAVANLAIVANDPNNDVLTFSASGLPVGLSINTANGMISGTPTVLGTSRVTVYANDGNSTVSTSFDWLVTQPTGIRYVKLEALSEVNGNPWTSAAEINVLDTNGAVINRTGWTVTTDSQETQGEDGRASNAIDGNASTLWHTQWYTSNPRHPHWIAFDMKANFNVTGFKYLPRQSGAINGTILDYKFYVSADGVNWGAAVAQGRFVNDRTEKSISTKPNQNPILATLTNRTNGIGEVVNFTLPATDPDGDALTIIASGLPTGLSLNGNTGVISGAPTTLGNFNVAVTVNDVRGGTVSGNFVWTITPPALAINAMTSAPKPVNTTLTYTASVSNAVNPRFKWLFGDGSAETAYSTSASITKTYSQSGIYVVKVTATDDRGIEQSTTFTQAIHFPTTTNRPAVSMNMAYETRAAGNARLWVVNQDNDTVSVFDAITNTKTAEIPVGTAPRSVAIAPNGKIWVTNKGAATISVIDPMSLTVTQTILLPYASQPFGIAFAPTGGVAYVALEAAGKLYKLDSITGILSGFLNVGLNVRHLSVSADGATVYVSRFITPRVPGEETAAPQVANGGGEVLVVNASTMSLTQTIRLQHSDKFDTENTGRGIPNYLGPAIISPDGRTAWTPSKQDNIARGTFRDGRNLTFDSTVRSITSAINLTTNTEDYPARIDYNNGGIASTGGFGLTGNYLFIALEGSREIAVVDVYGKRELFRIPVGRAPQGVIVAADGKKLFVNNFMDRTVSVLDINKVVNEGAYTAPVLATMNSVATEKLSAQVLQGKQFFYDAKDTRLARDAYISCASCHNDGGQDGRIWDLTGMGEGLRNTISLQGRAGAQGFLHWSANFDEVQDFEGQIRNLSGGTGLMNDADFNFGTRNQSLGLTKAGISADLDALAAYVASLKTFSPSPYRNNDGTLTADAVAGKEIFRTQNCAQCHSGTLFTEAATGQLRNIGTLKPSSGTRLSGVLTGIDSPTLRDVWATAPYLHDGSVATLDAAVTAHNGVTLSATDLQKLVSYLQQIGVEETTAPTLTANLAQGKAATQSSTGWGGDALRAVDGITDGNYNNNSVTHTNYDANAWWQVDLGGTRTIDSVQIFNRTDCCGYRLSYFYVFVSNTDMTGRTYNSLLADSTITKFLYSGQAPTNLSIPAGANGRYVRVQLSGTNYLSLAEVQVWGR